MVSFGRPYGTAIVLGTLPRIPSAADASDFILGYFPASLRDACRFAERSSACFDGARFPTGDGHSEMTEAAPYQNRDTRFEMTGVAPDLRWDA